MGKAGYLGGHTKIFLSEDGTVWPEGTSPDSPGEDIKSLRGPTRKRRWSDDGFNGVTDAERKKINGETAKEQEFRILAEYASSFRTKNPPRLLRGISAIMIESIERQGGVVEWINANPSRLARFWRIVAEQREPSKLKNQNRPLNIKPRRGKIKQGLEKQSK